MSEPKSGTAAAAAVAVSVGLPSSAITDPTLMAGKGVGIDVWGLHRT
jgi:hypothetical protein